MKRAAILVCTAMLGAGLASGLTGCAPVIESHGYAPNDAALASVVSGQDTKGSVQRKIGRPVMTGVFDKEAWFYESETVEKYLWHAPKVTDRRVVAIDFNPTTDVVASVHTYGLKDGKVIDLVTRTTPTFGRKLTLIQQLLGNLGRFNEDTFKKP